MAASMEEVDARGCRVLIATASFESNPPALENWKSLCVDPVDVRVYHNQPNVGVVEAYDVIYLVSQDDYIVYIHDDVTLHEKGWDRRVAREFEDPSVAIVGLGGAIGIGTPLLYKKPYRIEQLIRRGYRSNQTDWQVHGILEEDHANVAVVDGFFMAVRRSFLDRIDGWSWMKTNFHVYDLALCLMALRLGLKVRMVGVRCTHHGGGGSTSPQYKQWCEERGTTMAREHSEPHVWLYNEFSDVMPVDVKP